MILKYESPSPYSLEGIHITEFLVSYLVRCYPSNWQSLFNEYRFYGESVEPGHHIFKFKGNLNEINEDHLYVEIPFSEFYKVNPIEASAAMDDRTWTQIVEKKKAEGVNPFWSLL